MKDEWYVRIGTEVRGPLSRSQVLSLLAQGLVTGEDSIGRNPGGPWVPLAKVLRPQPPVSGGPTQRGSPSPSEWQSLPAGEARARAKDTPAHRLSEGVPGGAPLHESILGAFPEVAVGSSAVRARADASRRSGASAQLSAAEIRRQRRSARRKKVLTLLVILFGVSLGGGASVWTFHSLRARWAELTLAKQRLADRRYSPPAQEFVVVDEDTDRLLTRIGGMLGESGDGVGGARPSQTKWLNAATEMATPGNAVVRIARVELGYARVVTTTGRRGRLRDPCVIVTLDISCGEKAKEFSYPGVSHFVALSSRPILQDDKGRALAPKISTRFRLEGQADAVVLRPGQSISDVLAFECPREDFRSLRLTLPGELFGVTQGVGFIISREMISDLRAAEPRPDLAVRPGVTDSVELDSEAGPSTAIDAPGRAPQPGSGLPTAKTAVEHQNADHDPEKDENRIPIPGVHFD